jgi:RES domain-containing protein
MPHRFFGSRRETPGADDQSRTCDITGLRLVPADERAVTRIAKSSYGPLNPVLRRGGSGGRLSWGRYDVAGHRTIYAADPIEGAYAESVAAQRLAQSISALTVGELFTENTGRDGLQQIHDLIQQEWAERNHMRLRNISASWREERLEYPLHLPQQGWFVDIEAPESISAIMKAMAGVVVASGREQLTIGDLRSTDRKLTTEIAAWIYGRILDDGSLPHGITYRSKHGNDWHCWATWLRAVDDGKPLESEPTKAEAGRDISPVAQNPCLERVARLFDVTIH